MKKYIITSAITALVCFAASAQTQQSAFFLDNSIYSYRTSPSLSGEKGFVGIGLGNINMGLQSDFGVTNFLFPTDKGLCTGLNSAISAQDFLGRFEKANSLDFNLDENILAVGFWGKRGYNTIEINVKGDVFGSLPYDMFAFLKEGSPRTYDLSTLHASGMAYAEVALGHSHNIGSKFTVGTRLKILAGLTNANVNFTRADFTIGDANISAAVDGQVRCSSDLLDIPVMESEKTGAKDVMDFGNAEFMEGSELKNVRPTGWGAALDLGVTYRPVKDLEVTASILDLGAINWEYNVFGTSSAEATITGLREDVYIKDTFNAIKDDFNAAVDAFSGLTEFHKSTGSEKSFEALPVTFNVGARYHMPFYRRLSAGILATYKASKYTGWFDMRAGLTITPLNFLSLSGNYGVSSFGPVCGAAVSFNIANLNFFFGYDGYSGSLAELPVNTLGLDELAQNGVDNLYAPLNAFRYNMRLGLNITFGKRHSDLKKVKKVVPVVDEFDQLEQRLQEEKD